MSNQVKFEPETNKILLSLLGKTAKDGLLLMAKHATALERDALRWRAARQIYGISEEDVDKLL